MTEREMTRNFKRRFNYLGQPYCKVSTCKEICEKFKNGNYRKYCDLHDGYSSMRERYWSFFKTRILLRDGKCVKCESKEKLEVDHIIALVNGGAMWDEDNLQTLCNSCHKEKTKKDLKK